MVRRSHAQMMDNNPKYLKPACLYYQAAYFDLQFLFMSQWKEGTCIRCWKELPELACKSDIDSEETYKQKHSLDAVR